MDVTTKFPVTHYSMKQVNDTEVIESIIRHSGLVVVETPSAEHPAAFTVAYRNNADGSVRWLCPCGGKTVNCFKKLTGIDRIFFALGLAGLIADGRLTLYADTQTVFYIRHKWSRAV